MEFPRILVNSVAHLLCFGYRHIRLMAAPFQKPHLIRPVLS